MNAKMTGVPICLNFRPYNHTISIPPPALLLPTNSTWVACPAAPLSPSSNKTTTWVGGTEVFLAINSNTTTTYFDNDGKKWGYYNLVRGIHVV